MPSFRSCCLTLLLSSLIAGGNAFAGAPEAFEAYINQMIPLSFKAGKYDAAFREASLMAQVMSEAQESLALASDSVILAEQWAPLILELAVDRCTEGILENKNLEKYLRTLFAVTQLDNVLFTLNQRKSRFKNIFDSYKGACAKGFESYKVSRLDFNLENVNIELADGTGVQTTVTDPVTLIITVVISIYQIFDNSSEKMKIEELKEKYLRESIKDEDYQAYAREACMEQQKTFQDTMDEYSVIYENLETALNKLGMETLKSAHDKIRACVGSYPELVINKTMKKLATDVNKKLEPMFRRDNETSLGLSSNIGLAKAIQKLQSASCGQGAEALYEIESLQSVSQIYSVMLPSGIEELIRKRSALCGGSYL